MWKENKKKSTSIIELNWRKKKKPIKEKKTGRNIYKEIQLSNIIKEKK
jgi:hypothetical protein